MNIIDTIFYTIKRTLKDKKSIINKILLPILLILILGTALNTVFSPSKLGITKVAYLNENEKASGSVALDMFLKTDEVKKLLDVVKVQSFTEGEDMVNSGEVTSLIYIDKDFSKSLENGDGKDFVKVYSSKFGNPRVTIVQNVVDSFIHGINAMDAEYKIGSTNNNYYNSTGIEEITITTSGKKPKAIDYYAVTMLVMTLMYGAMYGSEGIAEDYFGETGKRIRSTPIKPYQQFTGKILGMIITTILQGIIVVLFTKFAFGANWGGDLFFIAFIIVSMSVFSTILGSMICLITKDSMRSAGIIALMVPVLTFIAGGYVKMDLENLMYISPNYLAQTAIFNTIYDGSQNTTRICIIAIWCLTLIVFTISLISARRRRNW
ncbi:ABC transporter permease [Bacillus thuringiensis]|uniref:ABC transporter permease n=1 Tax=Bacillus thuringiensis TaxID=1428 RepID=UPI000BF2C9CD|nr:ABC transporter permease [Bacillus thuringiensis]PFJ51506.1 ABC transporter [Bacillus thuringiensis]PFR39092.1 ABC transporter [Bacillus thuringiensis]PGL28055.1 ABC transporter [Bacillus thuringiensis]